MAKQFQPQLFKKKPFPTKTKFPKLTEGRVLVMRDEVEEKTKGGLYLPDSVKDEQDDSTVRGYIVAMGALMTDEGEEIKTCGYDLRVGSRIAFGKYAGTEFQWGDKEYIIMRIEDIFGTWDENDEL